MIYAAALFAAIVVCYAAFILPTLWLKIEKVRHPLGLNVKILQISDMHVERLRISPRRLSALIGKEAPDYIFITGDFTKQQESLPRLDAYLRMLSRHRIPTFAVLGNHDLQQRKVIRLVKLIQYYGITLLRNESARLPGFRLIGIEDYYSGKSNIAKSFEGIAPEEPRIVITHDPNIVLALHERYDYLMAGHLHGKQFAIPFFYRFRKMGKLPAMGIYKGLHTSGNGSYYISKGIGQTGINARFLVRSEVTLHYL